MSDEQEAARKERARLRAAAWRAKNPERVKQLAVRAHAKRKANWQQYLAAERARYRANPERKLTWQAAWIAANPERRAEISRRAYRKNPHAAVANTAKRRAAKLRATPSWADMAAIKGMYAAARMVSEMMGEPYEVDHVVPLQGRAVCGLHDVRNLRIAPRSENRRKAAKLVDDSPPHQP